QVAPGRHFPTLILFAGVCLAFRVAPGGLVSKPYPYHIGSWDSLSSRRAGSPRFRFSHATVLLACAVDACTALPGKGDRARLGRCIGYALLAVIARADSNIRVGVDYSRGA